MKTYIPKKDEIERKWYVVDATGKTLGKLASQIAHILRGKHKPYYTPFLDTGDFVICINAEKIRVSGPKLERKKYYRHSGYIGGLREISLKDMLARHPERVIYLAVKRMLPNTRLGRKQLKKLKVYAGDKHPHLAQKPEELLI